MTRREKAARIGEILDALYPAPPIPLAHQDPFSLLVAVMLSAQTTDVMVNRVTPALLERAPTAAAMAVLAEEEILAFIRPVGLAPTKARHLRRLAQLLVEGHEGLVPADLAALEALPGVGHKTASVVMVQAFGEPAFPVDTHIHRVAQRWGLSDGSSVARTERDLRRLWPPGDWGRRHLQLIWFGREYCPARGHDPGSCPVCSWAGPQRRASRGGSSSPPKSSARARPR